MDSGFVGWTGDEGSGWMSDADEIRCDCREMRGCERI